MTEAVFTANHLTDTDKLNTTGKYTNSIQLKKQTMQKYSKTKLLWFSRLSWHSARKRGWVIVQCSWAHTGQV